MAACAHCGAKLGEDAATCPACGQRVRDRPFAETLPLGSLTEPPTIVAGASARPAKETLALGSGVPLDGGVPSVRPRVARPSTPEPKPLDKRIERPQREKSESPREKREPPREKREPPREKREPPREKRPRVQPKARPRVEASDSAA